MSRLPPDVARVVAHYVVDCNSLTCRAVDGASGFSGAAVWRLDATDGPLCLRRWPSEHPTAERLAWIHQVVVEVHNNGFTRLPAILPTSDERTFVRRRGHLWELTTWAPGAPIDAGRFSHSQRTAAAQALAEFHLAAETARLPPGQRRCGAAPGIVERRATLLKWFQSDLSDLLSHIDGTRWPALAHAATEVERLIRQAAPRVLSLLESAAERTVDIQACLRDVRPDHLLFDRDRVVGLIDVGAMRPDHVGADIARLTGEWTSGDRSDDLRLYDTVRPLSSVDLELIRAYDQSGALMAPVFWLDWVFRQRRRFDNQQAVERRFELVLRRLRRLADHR